MARLRPPEPILQAVREPRPRWRLAVGGAAVGVGAGLFVLGLGLYSKDDQCVNTAASGFVARLDQQTAEREKICPEYIPYRTQYSGMSIAGSLLLGISGAVLMIIPGQARQVAEMQ